MNERIRELLEQTDIPLFPLFENQPPAWVASDYGMEKFAELIVKECISRVSFVSDGIKQFDSDNADGIDLCDVIASDMKKHFGVE